MLKMCRKTGGVFSMNDSKDKCAYRHEENRENKELCLHKDTNMYVHRRNKAKIGCPTGNKKQKCIRVKGFIEVGYSCVEHV